MSAKIISMMNQKGGSGKTTTCQHSAIAMASTGKRVLIIDCDPQLTAFKFFVKNHDKFPNGYDGVIDVSKGDVDILKTSIAEYSDDYDYIFVDTAPALGKQMSQIISFSDMVVVCVQSTFKDIEATQAIVNSIKSNMVNDPSLSAMFCITRRKGGANISKSIDKLNAMELPIMASQIREYNCYNDADEAGVGVIHLASALNADKAASDIHEFTTELISYLGD